jgi:hypothetical protein
LDRWTEGQRDFNLVYTGMQNGLKIGNFDLQGLAVYYVEDILAFPCTF